MFCDLTLILDDHTDKKIINVNKIVLYEKCICFEKLLSSLPNQSEFIIKVHNADVAYDTIIGLYGIDSNIKNYPGWKHQLETFICRHSFELPNDNFQIKDIQVPPEGFNLLIEVINIIGYNTDTISAIADNLPEICDLSIFPDNIRDKIHEFRNKHYIFTYDNDTKTVSIINTENGKIIRSVNLADLVKNNRVWYVDYCHKRQLVTLNTGLMIYIYDLTKNKIVDCIYFSSSPLNFCSQISFSQDGRYIACKDSETGVQIYDLDKIGKYNMHKIINPTYGIQHIEFTHDSFILVTYMYIEIYDALSFEHIRTIYPKENYTIHKYFDGIVISNYGWETSICDIDFLDKGYGTVYGNCDHPLNNVNTISNDKKEYIVIIDNNIHIYNRSTQDLIKVLILQKKPICINYSLDSQQLGALYEDVLQIWNIKNEFIRNIKSVNASLPYCFIKYSE